MDVSAFIRTERCASLSSCVAGVVLAFMLILTVTDVILRAFRRPILGTLRDHLLLWGRRDRLFPSLHVFAERPCGGRISP